MNIKRTKIAYIAIILFSILFQLTLIAQESKFALNKKQKDSLIVVLDKMKQKDTRYRFMISAGTFDEAILKKLKELSKEGDIAKYLNFRNSYEKTVTKSQLDSLWELQHQLDFENYLQLKEIIKNHGFPSEERLNIKDSPIFSILLHPPVQVEPRDYLKKMSQLLLKEVKAGRMQAMDFASFYDNIKVKILREPQLYGTNEEFDPRENKILPPVIVNVEETNKVRVEIGLKPLKENEYRMMQTKSNEQVLKINSQNFTILFPEANSTIDLSFKELDSVNNYNIPYLYKGKYLSATIKQGNDSISFQPKKEKDISVQVSFEGETKIINLVFIESPTAKYTQEYIKKNSNSIQIEIPELYELLNVAIAITKFNNDPNYKVNPGNEINFMVNKKTEYYNEVISAFSEFDQHPLVTFLDKQFAEDFNRYHLFTANIYCLSVKNDKVFKKDTYSSIWMGKSHFDELILLVEDFYKKTAFKAFYAENKNYYNLLIDDFKNNVNIDKIHNWLEDKSGLNYNSFKYIISPLVFAGHKTQKFNQGNFSECLVFLPTRKHNQEKDLLSIKQETLAHFIGLVFTEVDHNYVNPITEKYTDQIEKSIVNLKDWNTKYEKGYYGSKLSTFNEYMTHALFLIYAKEELPKPEYDKIRDFWITQESDPNKRCFVKFGEFYEKLDKIHTQQLYQNQKFTIRNSISLILNWVQNED